MIYKNTGLITYHGPMACTDFSVPNNNFTYQNFCNAINKKSLTFDTKITYQNGYCEGIIWGGNLSTVISLCGIDFLPQRDFIFFAEDLNEPVYKIDRMFQQLLNMHDFTKYCKGIALGEFLNVDNNTLLKEYFTELGLRIKIPIYGGFKITHSQDKITIPIGKYSYLDNKKLFIK